MTLIDCRLLRRIAARDFHAACEPSSFEPPFADHQHTDHVRRDGYPAKQGSGSPVPTARPAGVSFKVYQGGKP
jgi:hypothetical protein